MIVSLQFIKQFIKFILVGFLNTAVYFGVLNLLMFFSKVHQGWLYSLFTALAFILSVSNSYIWNKRWTFQKGKHFEGNEFSKFLLISSIAFALNVGIASFLNNSLGPQFNISPYLWANLSAVVAGGFTTLINFFGYKYLVFGTTRKPISLR